MHLKLGVWDQSLEPEYSRLFGSFFVNFSKNSIKLPVAAKVIFISCCCLYVLSVSLEK